MRLLGRRDRRDRPSGPVLPGLPAGQPARQRGADPPGPQGPVERAAAVRRQAVRVVRRPPRACRAASRRSTRACSRNLAKLAASGAARADLEAILLTGIPAGIVPGFQNFTGPVLADMLRLNTAIAPSKKPNELGLIGGDPAGFPNGRRVFDDVVTIELRAIAGVTVPLVDKSFTPDAAAARGHRRADGRAASRPATCAASPTSGCRTADSRRRDRAPVPARPAPAASSWTWAARSARSSWRRTGRTARPGDRDQPGRRRRGPAGRTPWSGGATRARAAATRPSTPASPRAATRSGATRDNPAGTAVVEGGQVTRFSLG